MGVGGGGGRVGIELLQKCSKSNGNCRQTRCSPSRTKQKCDSSVVFLHLLFLFPFLILGLVRFRTDFKIFFCLV